MHEYSRVTSLKRYIPFHPDPLSRIDMPLKKCSSLQQRHKLIIKINYSGFCKKIFALIFIATEKSYIFVPYLHLFYAIGLYCSIGASQIYLLNEFVRDTSNCLLDLKAVLLSSRNIYSDKLFALTNLTYRLVYSTPQCSFDVILEILSLKVFSYEI